MQRRLLRLFTKIHYVFVCFGFGSDIIVLAQYCCLIIGASACVQLQRYEDAITWCEKGLAVSLTICFMFLAKRKVELFVSFLRIVVKSK